MQGRGGGSLSWSLDGVCIHQVRSKKFFSHEVALRIQNKRYEKIAQNKCLKERQGQSDTGWALNTLLNFLLDTLKVV